MYYHCSPIHGLKRLEPRKPQNFDKPGMVYMTTLLPMALMYGVRNFEYTYGYTKAGQIYYDEYFHDALRVLYEGKSASLYECAPQITETTRIPNEVVSPLPVEVVHEVYIPDVMQALLEQERLGALVIHRYEQLTPKMRDWIFLAELEEIYKRNLLKIPCPMADYVRQHYPAVWEAACKEAKQTPED